MDPEQVLAEIEAQLNGSPPPNTATLKIIRARLDDYAFLTALKNHLRSINDPDVINRILTLLSTSMRTAGDLSASRRVHSEIGVRIGIGTGVGLVAGSIIAAVSAPLPIITLIVIFGGLWMAGSGYVYGRKLNEETELYKNIAERLAKIQEAVHVR